MGVWSDFMETETYEDNDEEVVENIDEEFDDSGWGVNKYSPPINIEQMNFTKSIRFYAECDINEIKKWLGETKDLTLEANVKYALTRFLTKNLNSANNAVSKNPSDTLNSEMAKSLKTVLLEILCDVYEEEILPTKEYITSIAISLREDKPTTN